MKNEKEINYWPGFVDALSNLVLTLVFVMVIFVLAMVYLSMSLTKKQIEKAVSQQVSVQQNIELKRKIDELKTQVEAAKESAAKAEELQRMVDSLKSQLKKVEHPNEPRTRSGLTGEISVSEIKSSQATKAEINIERFGEGIVIRFPVGRAELDASAREALTSFMKDIHELPLNTVIDISSTPGPEIYTEARRAAYFRAVLLRNHMIANGYLPSQVQMHILDKSDNSADQTGSVIIRLKKIK